jgi:hypothetical protein
MFSQNGTILWDRLDPSNLPKDLVCLRDGELAFIIPGGVDVKTFAGEVGEMSASHGVNSVKSPNLLWRLLANNNGVLGAVVRCAIKACVLRPAVGICRWCHSVLNFSTNVKRVRPYQRGRASITGLGL